MKVGLIGLPNSGKTTIFNLLTGHDVPVENYFTQGTETHLGTARVLDPRLTHLAEMNPREQTKYADIAFVDMAGFLVEKTGHAHHSPAAFFSAVRDVDALVYVVRAFAEPEVMQLFDTVDPKRDVETIESELMLADLELTEKRLERVEKELQARRDKTSPERDALLRCKEAIESNRPLRLVHFTPDEARLLSGFRFLSLKPVLVCLNLGEEAIGRPTDAALNAICRERDLRLLDLPGKIEVEIAHFPVEEQQEYLAAEGIDQRALPKFVAAAFALLNLVSFFTIGDKEVKAWTVPSGTTAHDGAGKIHTDMQRGFIRAEVVAYDDLAREGSMKTAKEKGLLRLEGKDYIIRDGDVIHFRFSV